MKQEKGPLTIMIEPKLRWYVELLARKWRCSMSDAISKALRGRLNKERDIQLLADQTWSEDVDEQIRLIEKHAPDLLTFSEKAWLEELWYQDQQKENENQ